MKFTTIFGWDVKQLSAAKARHKRITGAELAPSMDSIIQLQTWYLEHQWPAPGTLVLADVELEEDLAWAYRAFTGALSQMCAH